MKIRTPRVAEIGTIFDGGSLLWKVSRGGEKRERMGNEISSKFRYGRRLVAEIGTIFDGVRLALRDGVRV